MIAVTKLIDSQRNTFPNIIHCYTLNQLSKQLTLSQTICFNKANVDTFNGETR